MYALIPAIAFLATIPFYVVGVLSTTVWISLAVLLVPTALGLAWLGGFDPRLLAALFNAVVYGHVLTAAQGEAVLAGLHPMQR